MLSIDRPLRYKTFSIFLRFDCPERKPFTFISLIGFGDRSTDSFAKSAGNFLGG